MEKKSEADWAYAIIACGTEVGENASVAAATALARDVPPGATAIGNPARIVMPASRKLPLPGGRGLGGGSE
jgi:acetyltransferase-like isoleucine patch superfamily enzyme